MPIYNKRHVVRCESSDFGYRYDLYGFHTEPDTHGPVGGSRGAKSIATMVEFEPHDNTKPVMPFMSLDAGDAQRLMDDLYRAGLRPTEAAGSAGAMDAVQKHLAFAQSVAAGALKKAGVEVKSDA